MDDGASGIPSTPVSALASGVPTALSVTVALPIEDLGKTYTFQLQVHNREGSSLSPRASFLFAVPPS
jgi:hypothetical protein